MKSKMLLFNENRYNHNMYSPSCKTMSGDATKRSILHNESTVERSIYTEPLVTLNVLVGYLFLNIPS